MQTHNACCCSDTVESIVQLEAKLRAARIEQEKLIAINHALLRESDALVQTNLNLRNELANFSERMNRLAMRCA